MGARTLEARLTARLLVLTGGVLVCVGVASVVVTGAVLDASDTGLARAQAESALGALDRELGEGDAPAEAVGEVIASARAQGVRVRVQSAPGVGARGGVGDALPDLGPGACATVELAPGDPWRACASSHPKGGVVAAVAIGKHRAAVHALLRGMASIVAVAVAALWFSVRRAVRAPAAELIALVGWTQHIVDTEQPIDPPSSLTREVAELRAAFDALVRRLLDVLGRERASSAHIAHELRTPLTAITAELEAVRAADDASREAIGRVRQDVARLADVIEAILVLSEGARAPRCDVVLNVADLARELAPAGVQVDAPDEALVEADERLVSLATRNLVDNAQKHGGGVRRVRVSRAGAEVKLAVLDAGPGLGETARARMFERYWRGSADGEGRGLGLALVRAVAERHGGRALAEPGGDGRGLEVAMTLGPLVGWHD